MSTLAAVRPISDHGSLPESREWLSLQQAALRFGFSVDTLRRRIRKGRLPGYRIDSRLIRVRIEDVEALFHPIPIGDRIVRRRRRSS